MTSSQAVTAVDASLEGFACEGLAVREAGGLLTVTLDRPAKRNAITLTMYRAMAALFTAAATRPGLKAILLEGAGGYFSAGADIGDFPQTGDRQAAILEHRRISDAAVQALADCPKPSIALVEGLCLGGGLSFAMACDFRIALPAASFGIPAARLGVVYSLSDCRRLHALVGLTAAKRVLYLGDRMEAAEALRIGLADAVIPDARGHAMALVAELGERAPLSIAGAKTTLDAIAEAATEARAGAITAAVRRAMDSQDMQEATAAFLEKRRPVFRGV